MKSRTVFYVKEGRKYKAVSEYIPELIDAIPVNQAMVVIHKENSTHRRYNVDPDIMPLIAASILLEDSMIDVLIKAKDAKIERNVSREITPEMREAWDNMVKVCEVSAVTLPSFRDIVDEMLKAMREKAKEIMAKKEVKEIYEQALLMMTLAAKNDTV